MGLVETDEVFAPLSAATLNLVSWTGEHIIIVFLHCLEGLLINLISLFRIVSIPVGAVKGDSILDIFIVDDIEFSSFHTITTVR